MKTWETLYHEDRGATLKHKCEKKDSNIAPSLFSLSFFDWLLWPLFFFSLFFYFLTWDNALIMKVITLLFTLQLKNYNSILRTKYDSI